jgi:hypothetical protein
LKQGVLCGEAQRRRRDIFVEKPFPKRFQPQQGAAYSGNHSSPVLRWYRGSYLRLRIGHEPKMPLLPELENLFFVLQRFRAYGATGKRLQIILPPFRAEADLVTI